MKWLIFLSWLISNVSLARLRSLLNVSLARDGLRGSPWSTCGRRLRWGEKCQIELLQVMGQ